MKERHLHISRLEPDRVYHHLHSRKEGLNLHEVNERLAFVGPNRFESAEKWKLAKSFIRQFTHFFTMLLFLSAGICLVAHRINPGESMDILGWALLGVALLNGLFSFIQEYRAEKAMEALRAFLPQQVRVRRGAKESEDTAERIVPGDVVMLAEGDKIPADLRIVEANALLVDNSPLTGESVPIPLTSAAHSPASEEPDNIGLAGCTVVRGSGIGVVFATGIRTEFGNVAHLSQTITRGRSPLERETAHMVRVLTIIACGMGSIFFCYGVVTGRPLWTNLVFMMGIIVANVPEGLLPTFTLSLAIGSLRLAKKNVLVKSLNSVESLGAVHVICSDKTGTLTLNRLTITHTAEPRTGAALNGEDQLNILRLALAASEVHLTEKGLSGDALDLAVAEKYQALGQDIATARTLIRVAFPFDVEKKRSAGYAVVGDKHIFVVKGAFEVLRPMLADHAAVGESAETVVHEMASRGLRVIGVAWRELTAEEVSRIEQEEGDFQEDMEHSLTLAGFLGIEDPIRPEVPDAVRKCRRAGIDIIIITGDHPDTAMAIGRQIGLKENRSEVKCLTGMELARLSVTQLVKKLDDGIRIFARTTPEQKMKIVTALQKQEKVVAMTGDGVNDAPALKVADVGIAMGRQGTDVARESAQIILLDDNFASIVAGIEEGRTIFANIRKFTNYVLVSNGPEILPYLLYILLPVPLALNVIQILSIDLGTDIIPSMALGQEPPDEESMNKPPRNLAQEGLLTPGLIIHSYLFLGLLEGLWSLALFFYVLVSGGWVWGTELPSDSPLYRSATGIALSTILLMQIGNLIGRRYSHKSGLDAGLVRNRLLLAGIVIQIIFSWTTLYWAPMQKILGTGPVAPGVYAFAWLGIALIFCCDYFRKKIVAMKTPPRTCS